MRILVVEDDRDLADSLASGLEEMGYSVDVAFNGIEGELKALSEEHDLLIVDWGMPKQDGKTMISRLRNMGVTCPVLMLTAYADIDYRVKGLDAGADDYLTKPFSFEELFARVRALGRRSTSLLDDRILTAGPIRLDTQRRVVTLDGYVVNLRPKEYALLELLLQKRDAVVTRTVIAERVWGTVYGVTEDVINMTVSSLRRALESEFKQPTPLPIQIRTIRGVGYRLEEAA